jgi:hypothetical protein
MRNDALRGAPEKVYSLEDYIFDLLNKGGEYGGDVRKGRG